MSGNELPPPDAIWVLARVAIEANVEALGPKKGERFLKAMADRMSSEERLAEVVRIRPRSDDAEVAEARRRAMAWFRQNLGTFIARL